MVIPDDLLASVTSDTSSVTSPTGQFFLVLSKGGPWWQSLKKHGNEKAVEETLEPLFQRYSQQSEHDGFPALSPPGAAGLVHQSHKYVYNSGGVAVCPGVLPVAAELLHVSPYVQQDEATQRIIVFFGWLSNLADVAGSDQDEDTSHSGHELGQSAYGDQTAHLTTRALLKLYDKLGSGQEILLLSELQGQFAFVIFDAAKKVVFAARDASGDEELFYAVASDGSVMFTNSLSSLPPEMARHAWQELPPGHYIAGKEAVPVQYALTRAELAARERRESNVNGSLDDDDPLQVCNSWDSSDGRESFSPRSGLLKRLSHRWGA